MDIKWYYSDGDKRLGPVSLEQLKLIVDSETLVYNSSLGNWVKAATIKELVSDCLPPIPFELQGKTSISIHPKIVNNNKDTRSTIVYVGVTCIVGILTIILYLQYDKYYNSDEGKKDRDLSRAIKASEAAVKAAEAMQKLLPKE